MLATIKYIPYWPPAVPQYLNVIIMCAVSAYCVAHCGEHMILMGKAISMESTPRRTK